MNICKDCKFHSVQHIAQVVAYDIHSCSRVVDPVVGQPTHCELARSKEGECGPKGELYMAKGECSPVAD